MNAAASRAMLARLNSIYQRKLVELREQHNSFDAARTLIAEYRAATRDNIGSLEAALSWKARKLALIELDQEERMI